MALEKREISHINSEDVDSYILAFEEYNPVFVGLLIDFRMQIQYTVLTKDDLFSYFREVYEKAIPKYDPSKGALFSTYLKTACRNKLIDVIAYNSRGFALSRKQLIKMVNTKQVSAEEDNSLSHATVIHNIDISEIASTMQTKQGTISPYANTSSNESVVFSDFSQLEALDFVNSLSKLEQMILQYKADGYKQKEIAKIMGVSQTYVSNRLNEIKEKAERYWG